MLQPRTFSASLDVDLLRQRFGQDAQVMSQALEYFLEDAPARLAVLRATLENASTDGRAGVGTMAQRAAHSLKGMCATLGAHGLMARAQAAEAAARGGRLDELRRMLPDLQREMDQALAAARGIVEVMTVVR